MSKNIFQRIYIQLASIFIIILRAVNSYRSPFLEQTRLLDNSKLERARHIRVRERKHANRTGPAQLVAPDWTVAPESSPSLILKHRSRNRVLKYQGLIVVISARVGQVDRRLAASVAYANFCSLSFSPRLGGETQRSRSRDAREMKKARSRSREFRRELAFGSPGGAAFPCDWRRLSPPTRRCPSSLRS